MKADIKKEQFFLFCIHILISIIFISNCTVFGKMGNKLYFLTIVIIVLWGILYKRIRIRYVSRNQISFLLLLIYFIIFGIVVGYDSFSASTLFIYYFLGGLLIFVDWDINSFYSIIRIVSVLILIMAVSILVEAISPETLLPAIFLLTSGSEETILREIEYGSYSGFAGEKADAAFYMNILFLIVICKCIHDKKVTIKECIILITTLIALMLTGKRTLFVTVFLITAILFLLSDIRFKGFKLFITALFGSSVVFSIPIFFPQARFLFERLRDTSESGRTELWSYAIQMFHENPIFGKGLGSYNQYIFEHGYLNPFTGEKWLAQCHCVYLQIIGELGIAGTILFAIVIIGGVYKAHRCLKFSKNGNIRLLGQISLAVQLLILLYGITGNTLFYPFQIVLYCFAIAITEKCYSRLK